MLAPSVKQGGIDIYYVDESSDLRSTFIVTGVSIPFLRLKQGKWVVVWETYLDEIKAWRRRASKAYELRTHKELHGRKLASGRGMYKRGTAQYSRDQAKAVYSSILSDLSFLPNESIISVVAKRTSNLYGHSQWEACILALFQRMRRACVARNRLGIVFFDEGHEEYRKMYRKARVYLPTGSNIGDWGSGQVSRNLPLDNFVKDANFKQSRYCYFTQLADIIAYALLQKVKGEGGTLVGWQQSLELNKLFDSIPTMVLNLRASSDPQGIVRL